MEVFFSFAEVIEFLLVLRILLTFFQIHDFESVLQVELSHFKFHDFLFVFTCSDSSWRIFDEIRRTLGFFELVWPFLIEEASLLKSGSVVLHYIKILIEKLYKQWINKGNL